MKRLLEKSEISGHLIDRFGNKKNKVDSIAIYGNGYFGKRLLRLFTDNGVNVKYVIDRHNADYYESGVHFVDSYEKVSDVDILVIAMSYDADEIAREVRKETSFDVYTIEDLLI